MKRMTLLVTFVRCRRQKDMNRHFEDLGNPFEIVQGDRSFCAFDAPDEIGGNLGFPSESLLCELRPPSMIAEIVRKNFPDIHSCKHPLFVS